MELSNQILSEITVYMKYARYIPELNRRETWEELVTRNKEMHIKKYPKLKDEIETTYKFVYDKKVFNIEGFYVKQVTDYAAIGAGMDFALAALYLGKTVKDSIKAACHLSVYCEEPINLIKINKK